MALAQGWVETQMVIVKGWYVIGPNVNVSNYTTYYIPAAQEVADDNPGIQVVNLYPVTYDLTVSPALGYGLHPTETGCTTIANYLDGVIS